MAGTRTLRDCYEAIKPFADSITNINFNAQNLYDSLLSAAFTKVFEFNLHICSDEHDKDPYFYTASLRGICEDIIVLKFLGLLTEVDRQEVVSNITMASLFDSMAKQSRFFEHYRPGQPILPGSGKQASVEVRLSELVTENTSLKRKHGWQSPPNAYLPSVRSMAKTSNLLDLYDFIYSMTSKWVHFSPRNLMRMGWGETQKDGGPDLKDGSPLSFTTRNFIQYYREFNEFYGSFLFVLFYDLLGDKFRWPTEANSILDDLRQHLDQKIRWPEDVTFEEMNIKSPSFLVRLLLHSAQRVGKGKNPQD